MTAQWVSDADHRWVMVCDQPQCTTRSEAFPQRIDFAEFQSRGWHIGEKSGDVCPPCLERGVVPSSPALVLAEGEAVPYDPDAARDRDIAIADGAL